MNPFEIFYYASLIHLVFVKIHPFQDGNGRAARLIEKWFLIEKTGQKATSVQLEKNYFKNLRDYYTNIRKIGLEYEDLDYSRCLDFLLMTVNGIDQLMDKQPSEITKWLSGIHNFTAETLWEIGDVLGIKLIDLNEKNEEQVIYRGSYDAQQKVDLANESDSLSE